MGFVAVILASAVTGFFSYSSGSVQAEKDLTILCVSNNLEMEKTVRKKSDDFLTSVSDLLSEMRNSNRLDSKLILENLSIVQRNGLSLTAYSSPELSYTTLKIVGALDEAVNDRGRNIKKVEEVISLTAKKWPQVFIASMNKFDTQKNNCYIFPNKHN